MKKILKILIINFTVILLLIYISEFICFNFIYGSLYPTLYTKNHSFLKKLTYKVPKDDFIYYDAQYEFKRKTPAENNNDKRPFLFLGCSYTYGYRLDIEDTFPYKFQKYTGIVSNNAAENGFGPDNVYKTVNFLKRENILKKDNYEYAIYTFMYNQIKRITPFLLSEYITSKIELKKNKSLICKLKYYADKLYTVKIIEYKRFINDKEKLFEYAAYTLQEINKILKQEIPDIKFVLLLYSNCGETYISPEERESVTSEKWKNLEQYGIIVINTKDLVGDILKYKEYQIDEGNDAVMPMHPNGRAWDIIIPQLCKTLKIKSK